MTKWEVKQGSDRIRVEQSGGWADLYVNEKNLCERMGANGSYRLEGRLPNGDEIKVSIDDILTPRCSIFLNGARIL